jgi:hypothetical protein
MSDENELKNVQPEANNAEVNEDELSDNQLDNVAGGLGGVRVAVGDLNLVNNEKAGEKK